VIGDTTGIVVSSVTYDHRDVNPGALHCCLPGDHVDGAVFAAAARRAGAVAFVCERDLGGEAGGGVQLVVGEAGGRPAMALAAALSGATPASSLRTVGVTGTNGKTTTTFFLRSVFEEHGWPTTVIGTLGGPRTTPEAPDLQRALAGARDSEKAAVALEVTSHALAQHRLDGYQHDVAVFTNLSQDHLDYHGSMEEYFAVRRGSSRPSTPTGASSTRTTRSAAVCSRVPRSLRGPFRSRMPSSSRSGSRRAVSVSTGRPCASAPAARSMSGTRSPPRPPPGCSACRRHHRRRALGRRRAGGRLEVVPNHLGATIAVDYAHTPDGLAEILRAARAGAEPGGGKVIVVFGCGGDRDRAKRP